MSNEELAVLVKAGHTEYIPQLWGQVEKFVSLQATKRARQLEGFGGVTTEDLYQSGFLALMEAVDSFDSEAGRSFIGWLSLNLKTAFAEAAGYRTRRRDMLDFATDLDAPIPGTDDLTAADSVADPGAAQDFEAAERRIWRNQLHTALEIALGGLPADKADILRRRFYQGQTLTEIAAEEGSSIETIRQREQKALRAMRNPRIRRELQQFVEMRTPYYNGTGLHAFQQMGSQVERLAILREEKAGRFVRGL